MEVLGKLFGSEVKVKIIRLFLFNPETLFDVGAIAEKVKEDLSKVRRELAMLNRISFLKHRMKRMKGGSRHAFVLNPNFPYIVSLRNLLTSGKPLQPAEIVKKTSPLGSVKLVLVAGVFIQNPDSRVDILIVGDNVKKTSLIKVIAKLEAEIGKELKYAYFSTSDFMYRLNMYDKLVRDILDYPHEKLVNKLALV